MGNSSFPSQFIGNTNTLPTIVIGMYVPYGYVSYGFRIQINLYSV